MNNMTALIVIGITVAFNLIIIKLKLERVRYSDAALDAGVLAGLSFLFMGTISGLMVATVASAIVSIYLWFYPPKEFFNLKF